MANTKSLNIDILEIIEVKEDKPHFDKVSNEFAEEHYGSYVLYKSNKESRSLHTRIYLDYNLGVEFRKELLKNRKIVNRLTGYSNYKKSRISLLNHYPEFESFIKDTALKITPENLSRIGTENYIRGFSVFLMIMRLKKYKLDKFSDLKNEYQNIAWDNLKKDEYFKKSAKELYTFFNSVSNNLASFILQKRTSNKNNSPLLGLPTTTLFQIDYYCRQEIKLNMANFNETKLWLKEYKNMGPLFSLFNLSYTYYYGYEVNKRDQRITLRMLALKLYNVELECWEKRIKTNKKYIYVYKNNIQKKKHKNLLEISKSGRNIMIMNEKICFFWMLESVENPLHPTQEKIEYLNIINWEKLCHFARNINVEMNEVRKRIYPNVQKIYPLYLFLLIREGINDEVLKNWLVHKQEKGNYLLGEDLGLVTIIQGLKSRSNDIQWTPIKNNSSSQKYIDFYLEWLLPIYSKSELDYFFQYCIPGGQNIYEHVRGGVWKKAKDAKSWFFKKYKIYLPNGDIVNYIDHRQPRVNVQFNDYLKGLDEWERQFNKNHKSIDTQLHYDNMDERKIIQRNKIGKLLNDVEGIFKGVITTEMNKKAKVFNGLFADCSNPENPSFAGSIRLKENEVCTDWFMCLVSCSKSMFEAKVHGPPVMAYLEYIEEQKEFLSEEVWEKEYGEHYVVINEIIENKMDNKSKIYSKINLHKYRNLVRMKFKRKRLLKKDSNAG